MGLSEALKEKENDSRLVNRIIDKGLYAPQANQKFVAALEDDAFLAKPVNLEDMQQISDHPH